MNDHDDRIIRKAFEESPPPEVPDAEWESRWESIRNTRPSVEKERPNSTRWWAFAAVFLVGLFNGVLIAPMLKGSESPALVTRIGPDAPFEEDIAAAKHFPSEALVDDRVQKDPEEGMAFLGLRNVNIVEVGQTEDGRPEYRMTGETARGIHVFMDYKGL